MANNEPRTIKEKPGEPRGPLVHIDHRLPGLDFDYDTYMDHLLHTEGVGIARASIFSIAIRKRRIAIRNPFRRAFNPSTRRLTLSATSRSSPEWLNGQLAYGTQRAADYLEGNRDPLTQVTRPIGSYCRGLGLCATAYGGVTEAVGQIVDFGESAQGIPRVFILMGVSALAYAGILHTAIDDGVDQARLARKNAPQIITFGGDSEETLSSDDPRNEPPEPPEPLASV